jgi:hypothetical protein
MTYKISERRISLAVDVQLADGSSTAGCGRVEGPASVFADDV